MNTEVAAQNHSAQEMSELSPVATKLIRRTAGEMLGKGGYTRSDFEDIQQELTLYLLKRTVHYNPARAHESTYLGKLLRNKAWKMIRHNRAKRRDAWKELPLQSIVEYEEGEPIYLEETLPGKSDANASEELRIDVNNVMANIPAELRALCECLRTMSWNEAVRELGIPLSQIEKLKARLRVIFTAAGLGPQA